MIYRREGERAGEQEGEFSCVSPSVACGDEATEIALSGPSP